MMLTRNDMYRIERLRKGINDLAASAGLTDVKPKKRRAKARAKVKRAPRAVAKPPTTVPRARPAAMRRTLDEAEAS
jgi:hypothetical protein